MNEPVAYTLDRDTARRVLHREDCLHREDLLEARGVPLESQVVLILKPDTLEDPQAIANALVNALGVLPRAMVIDADAPVPEGFAHQFFVEAGEAPHFRSTRGQMVHEIIPPIQFCD